MARTFIRQSEQIGNSDEYNDVKSRSRTDAQDPVTMGKNLVDDATSIEDDLNALRTMTKVITGAAHWYNDVGRNMAELHTDLEAAESTLDSLVLADSALQSSLDSEIAARIAADSTLQSDIDSLDSRLDGVTSDIAVLTSDIVVADSNMVVLAYTTNVIGSDIVALNSDADVLSADISELQSTIVVLRSDVGVVGSDIDALQTRMSTTEGDITALESSLDVTQADLDTLEGKTLLQRTQVLTDIAVPASQNYVVLSASEDPTYSAAVGAVSTVGAVAAYVASAGTHSLAEVAGANAINPKNLCIVRDATTGLAIQDENGKDVYALLQFAGSDGGSFDGSNGQLSFVVENATADDLVACSASAIAGKTVNYSYAYRFRIDTMSESAFIGGVFVDMYGLANATLDVAVDNQSGPVTQAQDIEWRIASTKSIKFQTQDGQTDIFKLTTEAGYSTADVYVNSDNFNVSSTTVDFASGALLADIDVGKTSSGKISVSSQNMTIATIGSGDLSLNSGGYLKFADGWQEGSNYSTAIKLASSGAEWNTFASKYVPGGGEISLLAALNRAVVDQVRVKTEYAVVSPVSANSDVSTGADFSTADFMADVNVYLNGVLLRNGSSSGADNDVYPGSSAAAGDVRFEFDLIVGDVVIVEVYAQV